MIGRALRACIDMKALGEKTITLDCDTIQADGGTRTAAITGAFVAMVDAIEKTWNGKGAFPVQDYCAAISVGMDEQGPILDLCYVEDSAAVEVLHNRLRCGNTNDRSSLKVPVDESPPEKKKLKKEDIIIVIY